MPVPRFSVKEFRTRTGLKADVIDGRNGHIMFARIPAGRAKRVCATLNEHIGWPDAESRTEQAQSVSDPS